MNSRAAAVETLLRVVDSGESLSRVLPEVLPRIATPEDRALAQELSYGVCRWYPQLAGLMEALLQKPLKSKDRDVGMIIAIGLYQLIHQHTPDYAAVDGAVEAVRHQKKSWATGLVNAVLRNYQRNRERLDTVIRERDETRLAHPEWLLERLRVAYPQDWQAIALAANERPPMILRVNLSRGSREDYIESLSEAGLSGHFHPLVPSAVVLESPVDVDRLPGFRDGRVSVQDAAAQLAAVLMDVAPGMRVLDACAAPGGKTAHVLEAAGDITLHAVEIDAERMGRIRENLSRLGLHARLVEGDAVDPGAWWDGGPYDRILLDAPCSATGVIRRHPDIKLHRREQDIPSLAAHQRQLLEALWPLLRPGGMLLYATCSILPQENEDNIADFLSAHDDARESPMAASWGHQHRAGRQILPGEAGMDGFYYARLNKK